MNCASCGIELSNGLDTVTHDWDHHLAYCLPCHLLPYNQRGDWLRDVAGEPRQCPVCEGEGGWAHSCDCEHCTTDWDECTACDGTGNESLAHAVARTRDDMLTERAKLDKWNAAVLAAGAA